jgi:hypothetical protein
MNLSSFLRWPLKAALSLLRRRPGVYFMALNLLMRWPGAYVFLRRWLFQEPRGTHYTGLFEQTSVVFSKDGGQPPKLAPLGPSSTAAVVAQRRLQRALWQQSRS